MFLAPGLGLRLLAGGNAREVALDDGVARLGRIQPLHVSEEDGRPAALEARRRATESGMEDDVALAVQDGDVVGAVTRGL